MNKPKITALNKPAITSGNKPQIQKSRIDELFRPLPELDPLANVDYTGELESDSDKEVSALLEGFQERAKREDERFRIATDSEFWFAVCFQSREQKEAFLQAMGWIQNGNKYLDGITLANQAGITLPKVDLPKPRPFSRKLIDLVGIAKK